MADLIVKALEDYGFEGLGALGLIFLAWQFYRHERGCAVHRAEMTAALERLVEGQGEIKADLDDGRRRFAAIEGTIPRRRLRRR